MKTKVSYDFDDTLSNGLVQHHAKLMKKKGFELFIVTSRLPSHKAPSENWNNDLYFVVDQLDIPEENVIFTAYGPKHEYFWDGLDDEFLFHLDDDIDEVNGINRLTKMEAFHFPYGNRDAQVKILNEIKNL